MRLLLKNWVLNCKTGIMKKIIYILFGMLAWWSCEDENSLIGPEGVFSEYTDSRDGKIYRCVTIGDQTWMAENLAYRLPLGSVDGCYTYREENLDTNRIEPARALFDEVVQNAINDGKISSDPLPEAPFFSPASFVMMYLDYPGSAVSIVNLIANTVTWYPSMQSTVETLNQILAETKTKTIGLTAGAGKTVHAAIRDGFKKATSAILDGNVTTLIAAAVLYALASGSVRGFAMTLALGIVLSMFSAMVVSRLLVNSLYGMGLKDAKYYGTKKERKGFPFVEKRKIFFTISCILLLAVPASMIFMHQTKGSALNFGLDFKGGTSINVPFNEDYSIEELDKEVEPVVEGVTKDSNIQMTKVVGGNNVIIKTRSLTLEEREQVYQAMADNFGVDTSEITFDNISSTVSKEMSQNAMKAVIIAVVCMLLYIWIRFRDIRFASSAILALMHDIAIVFGFYVVSRISVGSTFIACMLTILGYSINSTIVIFDRIRENLPELKREPIESLVDRCITDTLTRSIYSSLTTFITIFVLFVMGVSSIRDFAAPLMVGIVCGAYTSVCITGALWYVMKHVGKNKYVPSKAVQNKTKNK